MGLVYRLTTDVCMLKPCNLKAVTYYFAASATLARLVSDSSIKPGL